MSTVLERLETLRIVPVVEIDDAQHAVALAHALIDGGLPTMEITLRTDAALDAIRSITAALPDFLVGAGTILTAEQMELAVGAGAKFAVSPGFTPELSQAASGAGIPFVPGAVTASEALVAAAHGHTRLKFFPAAQSGGAPAISALTAPLAGLGIRFMPTGGVRPETLCEYLDLPGVFAVGGTWIATRDRIRSGEFAAITEAAVAALAL